MAFRPTFATEIRDIGRNETVYVESVNVFDSIRVGNIVTPTNGTRYEFTKSVDLGLIQFVASSGTTVEFVCKNLISNLITSQLTGTTPLFSGDFGRLIIKDMDITFSTGEGNLFDVTATSAPLPVIRLEESLISGGNSIGEIKGALCPLSRLTFSDFDSGILLDSNGFIGNIGIQIRGVNFFNVGGTQITIQGDQSFITVQDCLSQPENGGFFLNMPTGAITKLETDVPSVLVTDNTVDEDLGGSSLQPGSINQSDPSAIFKLNTPLTASYRVSGFYLTNNSDVTTISFTNTYTDIEGTAVEWDQNLNFTFSDSPNELLYIGLPTVAATVNIDLSVSRESGNAQRIIRAGLFKDSGSGFVIVPGIESGMSVSGNKKTISINGMVTLNTNDVLKIMIKNEQSTDNVIVEDMHINVEETS